MATDIFSLLKLCKLTKLFQTSDVQFMDQKGRPLFVKTYWSKLNIPDTATFANPSIRSIHCNENPIYVFVFWELRGLSPNFHIYVSVSDLYIPRICPHIFLQQNRQTDPGNI
jgi:hypothetical protein